MKNRLLFLLKTYIFWVLLFVLAKCMFLIYQLDLTIQTDPKLWFLSIWNGLKMDIAMTAYIILLYSAILSITFFLKGKVLKKTFEITNIIVSSLFILVITLDFELYRNWGFHIDTTPLQYLKTPKEAAASINYLTLFIGLILYTAMLVFSSKLYKKWVLDSLSSSKPVKFYTIPVFLIIGGTMVIPARGGFDVQPMNTSFVYYCSNIYANHIAVNPVWNFLYALDHMDNYDKNYDFTTQAKAEKIVANLLKDDAAAPKVISKQKPNIMLIILESFSSDLLNHPEVVPNLVELTKSGVFFENFYATCSRSDKGLSSILSAFPAYPGDAIIKNSSKVEKMPNIGNIFKNMAYHNEFFYGGDINFANLKSYLNISRFDEITTKLDFPTEYYGSKWGVHDEYIFDHVSKMLPNQKSPWFNTLYTLSSHEPFDVPDKVIKGESVRDKFLNTALYTDKHLGLFMDKLKQDTALWNNTVVIITADHGSAFVNKYKITDRRKYHIPLIWTGGAINQDTVISKYCSQTDIIATLLGQLDQPKDEFIFSKDILSPESKGFAYYSYRNEGAAYLDENHFKLYDEIAKQYLVNEGSKDADNYGRAYLQVSYNYFLNK